MEIRDGAIFVAVVWQTIPSLQYILLGYQGETRAITPCADLASYEQTTIELFEAARDGVVYNPGHQQRSQATISNVCRVYGTIHWPLGSNARVQMRR